MTWPLPSPRDIADQASSDFEERLADARPDLVGRIDARSNRSVLRVISVVIGLALYPVYLFFSWILDQAFVDRCSETWLAVHARIWGVARIGATRAVGSVTLTGAEGTTVVAGARMTLSTGVWRTTATAVIGVGGSVSVGVEAVTAGAIGNQTTGAQLTLEAPVVGLARQTATVDAGGISGGADRQSIEDWRADIIAWIREPGHGGADFDYARWAKEILLPARVKVHRNWVGAGTVGVAFAMPDGAGGFRTPTGAEVAAMQTGLDARAPVTATVYALAAVPLVVPVTVAVSPYTTAVRTAIIKAATAYFRSADVQIAGKIHLSRLDERLSRAAGEQWHSRAAPVADVVVGPLQFPVLGLLDVSEAT